MISERDERTASLDRIEAVYGPSGWNFARRKAWLAAVADLSADAVERGSLDMVREFEGRIPTPANLRSFATRHQRKARPARSVELPVDEAALTDARAALDDVRRGRGVVAAAFTEQEILEQIASIESRKGW